MIYAELAAASNFSFLRGASHPADLVERALRLGLAGLGIADRNTVAGVVRAHAALKALRRGFAAAGLAMPAFRLVVGARLAFIDGTPDIVAYPEDRAGWARLCRLLTLGNLRGAKGECRLALADLEAHAAGLLLIAIPGDAGLAGGGGKGDAGERRRGAGEATEDGDEAGAGDREEIGDEAAALARLAAAAPGALWLGATMPRRGSDRRRLAERRALAARLGVPLVAVNDVLYHAPEQRPLQDVLTCIREGVRLSAAGRLLEANAERHLKPPGEMARLFADAPEAVAETTSILARIDFSLDQLRYDYPDEPVPPGRTAQQHLTELAWRRAALRYPAGIPPKVRGLLEDELALVAELDYARYFLTIHDIVRFAESRGILCQGRGSAANSVICFLLGITNVDPEEIDVLFARFISKERQEPPDIDVDFEHERREEVIQYIYERYGRHRAGIAATVISYRPRSAIREVGKALGLSEDVTAAIAATAWGWGGSIPDAHVAQAGFDPANPGIARAIRLATALIGFPRHLSQHVGGFILTRDRLDEIVPVGNAAMPGRTFVEWDRDDIDELGLLKVDVLALGMLTCIRKALDLLRDHAGLAHDLASVPTGDPAVYDMLCEGDSIGVFQVESRAQINMLPRLRPRVFYDLVIQVAIVRPGPIQGDMVHPYLRRRQGRERVEFPEPGPGEGPPDELHQVLGKTLGVPLFQEQAMRLAMVAARFSPEEANGLRRAMATFRNHGSIGVFEEKMVSRMVARGYEPDFARRCFEQIKGFGSYGFPESHAAAFAHLVYVSAWLKRHHPAAFACALLNAQPMGFYAPAQIVRDAREHGVPVRPIDVNHSRWDNTLEPAGPSPGGAEGGPGGGADRRPEGRAEGRPESAAERRPERGAEAPARGGGDPARRAGVGGPALRLGLRQVDGFREAWADVLAERRGAGYPDLETLARRTALPRAALEKLADADACRSLGLTRREALWAVRRLPDDAPLPLFAVADAAELAPEPEMALPAMPLAQEVVADYQTLRLSLKAHPMAFLRQDFAREGLASCAAVGALADGRAARTAGVVLVRQRPGNGTVVFMTIEDETGICNIVIWARMLERYRRIVMGARLIEIRGRVQRSPEQVVHLVADDLVDRTGELARLSEEDRPRFQLSRADEFVHPQHARTSSHPRHTRIIPKSRDFH